MPQFTFSADYKAFFEVLNKAEIIISSPLQYFRLCFFAFLHSRWPWIGATVTCTAKQSVLTLMMSGNCGIEVIMNKSLSSLPSIPLSLSCRFTVGS